MSAVTEMWWRTRGFSEFPSFRHAKIGERFYRVLGGPTSQLYGSFYTLTHPKSASQAEFDLNIVKWGNLCLYVASFEAREQVPLYIGRVDQSYLRAERETEEFVDGNFNAEQVWIDRKVAERALKLACDVTLLLQDKTVHGRIGHA
jgi:hypothetical protein